MHLQEKKDACISKSKTKNNQGKTTCPHTTDGSSVETRSPGWSIDFRSPHLTCKERLNRRALKDSLESFADCALHWRNPFNRAVTSGPPTDDLCHPARRPALHAPRYSGFYRSGRANPVRKGGGGGLIY